MDTKTELIKGSCETCGYAYEGEAEVDSEGGVKTIKCPQCHEVTYNNDLAAQVDENDKAEADGGMEIPSYNHVEKFEYEA